jgi:hypothetical protein
MLQQTNFLLGLQHWLFPEWPAWQPLNLNYNIDSPLGLQLLAYLADFGLPASIIIGANF